MISLISLYFEFNCDSFADARPITIQKHDFTAIAGKISTRIKAASTKFQARPLNFKH